MPLADELTGFLRSRGIDELRTVLGRVMSPTSSVMRNMGPIAGRLANDLEMTADDAAAGVGRYVGTVMPLENWEKIAPEKRVLASRIQRGWASPDEATAGMADPEVNTMVSDLRNTFAQANAENLAATDHLGRPLQVRNPFSGELRDYQPIPEDYFPQFVKRSKRDSVLDPINYAQSELERTLTRDYQHQLGLDLDSVLPPDVEARIQKSASDAIDDFLRTGQANQIVSDPKLTKALTPAYDTMQELHQHLMKLNAAEAAKTGGTPRPELDPIIEMFGSTDPTKHQAGIKMFREYLLRDAQQARRFGSIEASRAMPLPRDWYEEDPLRVTPVYILRQQRRLAEIKRFGQNNEVVLDPVTGVLQNITNDQDRAFAGKAFERAMGLEPYNKSLKLNNLNDWAYATQVLKLGTAQISQLGQVMNVIMETGLGPAWHALNNLGQSKQIAERSGASLSRVMDIVREGLADPMSESKPRAFVESFLKYTGFSKMDLIARHIGAGAGYAHGQNLLYDIIRDPQDFKALRELRRLVPGARRDNTLFTPVLDQIAQVRQQTGGNITREAVEEQFRPVLEGIARTASLNANFRNSILDLPLWASSPMGKLVSMFRTFSYRQGRFMVDRAMDDWRNGNPRTLIALGAAAGALGPMISALKAVPRGTLAREQEDYTEAAQSPTAAAKKAIENIATVGGMGMFDSVVRAMTRGDTGLFEFIMGPLFSDMVHFVSGPGKVATGLAGIGRPESVKEGAEQFGQVLASHVPVVGGAVSRAMRTLEEPVVRHPEGVVTRGQRQVLGDESPPLQIGGLTLPAPSVLIGFEQSAYAKRGRILDKLKEAISRNQIDQIPSILAEAQRQQVRITTESLNRLIREREEQ